MRRQSERCSRSTSITPAVIPISRTRCTTSRPRFSSSRSPANASSGSPTFREWRSNYPASTSFEFREVRGKDDFRVAEISVRYDQGPASFGISVLELREGKIARESIYVTESWEPPEWRARWQGRPLAALWGVVARQARPPRAPAPRSAGSSRPSVPGLRHWRARTSRKLPPRTARRSAARLRPALRMPLVVVRVPGAASSPLREVLQDRERRPDALRLGLCPTFLPS